MMKIVLADDHLMFREMLRALLEREAFEVVGEAPDGREAARLTHRLGADVAVLDLAMPLLNGVEAAREIRRRAPKTFTILLTMHQDDACVLGALQAGIRGYVLKTQAAADLVKAIREVMRGKIYLSPGISRGVVDACRLTGNRLNEDPLTDRERQVLQLVVEGKSTKEAAADLSVSIKTAEWHRSRIMEKLDVHNTAGLVRYAIRAGLIRP